MSKTRRAYNKITYFRRCQQEFEFRWTFMPPYHPWKQFSCPAFKFRCWDCGVTKKYLSKKRRLNYKRDMIIELFNL